MVEVKDKPEVNVTDQIAAALKKNPLKPVADLCAEFDCSEATVRRAKKIFDEHQAIGELVEVKLADVDWSLGTQMRPNLDPEAVEEYRLAYEAKADMPPLGAVRTPRGKLIGYDGFHRNTALAFLERETAYFRVFDGDAREAIWRAIQANKAHGLRRDAATKRNAVLALLRDKEWSKLSEAQLADHAGVSRGLVAAMIASSKSTGTVEVNGQAHAVEPRPEATTGADGKARKAPKQPAKEQVEGQEEPKPRVSEGERRELLARQVCENHPLWHKLTKSCQTVFFVNVRAYLFSIDPMARFRSIVAESEKHLSTDVIGPFLSQISAVARITNPTASDEQGRKEAGWLGCDKCLVKGKHTGLVEKEPCPKCRGAGFVLPGTKRS